MCVKGVGFAPGASRQSGHVSVVGLCSSLMHGCQDPGWKKHSHTTLQGWRKVISCIGTGTHTQEQNSVRHADPGQLIETRMTDGRLTAGLLYEPAVSFEMLLRCWDKVVEPF